MKFAKIILVILVSNVISYALADNVQVSELISEFTETNSKENEIDLSLINEKAYDLTKPVFKVRPTLGQGIRDFQNQSGGSACTTCAH